MDENKTVDPIAETIRTEQPVKGRRGRKPGDKAAPKQTTQKGKLTARQLTGMLYIGHTTAAHATGIQALAIEENEAEMIANALVDVLQYYDIEASGKTVAWANLAGTLAMVYGLKIAAFLKQQADQQTGI